MPAFPDLYGLVRPGESIAVPKGAAAGSRYAEVGAS